MVITGAAQMGLVQKEITFQTNNLYIDSFNMHKYGTTVLIIGAQTVLTGLVGILTARHKKLVFTVPFVLITFILGIALIAIAGSIITYQLDYGVLYDKHACGKLNKEQLDPSTYAIQTVYNTSLYDDYNEAVSNWVCSKRCPCWTGKNNVTYNLWESYDNETYADANRVFKTNTTLKVVQDIFWTENKTESYNNFAECYKAILANLTENETAMELSDQE